jgi:5-oxoprolinase (ATP-hydrolysing)
VQAQQISRWRFWIDRGDGGIVELLGSAKIEMHAGDVFVIETPGGGYGPPRHTDHA